MHPLVNTSADRIVVVVKRMLLRMRLKIENGASAVAGTKSGVATQLKLLKENVFLHTAMACLEPCCWRCYLKFERLKKKCFLRLTRYVN